jgi:TPR repeat protein
MSCIASFDGGQREASFSACGSSSSKMTVAAIVASLCYCIPVASGAQCGEPQGGPPTKAVEAGIAAYNSGHADLAFRLLKPEADRGQSDAQVNLGYLYARGQAVAANQREAFRLYSRSAEQGNGEGMNALGYKFQFGTGVARDIDKAVYWYCLAVHNGNPRAMNNLAILLAEGRFVPQNVSDARGLWHQAIAMDHVNAMVGLGLSLLNGPSPLEPEKGRDWLLEAARRGQPYAQKLMRQLGVGETFPSPIDVGALMQLQPRDGPPGHAEICGALVS